MKITLPSIGLAQANQTPRTYSVLTDADRTTLIALQQMDGLGPVQLNKLVESIEKPSDFLGGNIDPGDIPSLSTKARKALLNFLRAPKTSVHWEFACRTMDWLQSSGSQLIGKTEHCFPTKLQEISDCPPFIYLRGNKNLLLKDSISIVGTRKPTMIGKRFTESLARELSDAGLVVVSGMALGIDTFAHQGAVVGAAGTLAVWATGLDRVYPESNLALAKNLITNGAILSEMPLGTPSAPGLFPRRNRIVSGVSLGTIVVEAALPSGSLITANLAAEQNREVFAVPGSVNNLVSKGCHQLIKDGAVLVESAADVLGTLNGFRSFHVDIDTRAADASQPSLQGHLKRVLDALDIEAVPFEVVMSRCNESVDVLNMALIDLELMGLIVVDAGLYSVNKN